MLSAISRYGLALRKAVPSSLLCLWRIAWPELAVLHVAPPAHPCVSHDQYLNRIYAPTQVVAHVDSCVVRLLPTTIELYKTSNSQHMQAAASLWK